MSQEHKWLKGCKQGDSKAFAALYETHVKRIYDYAYFKTYHKETAEDITSSTFMKAFGQIQRFDPKKGAFLAWLYRIARNEICDVFRQKHPSLSLNDVWDLPTGENVEIDAINRENYRILYEYLQNLTPEKRDILILRIWQDLPFQEIASILKQNEGQCKMAFYRIIKKMQKEVALTFLILMMVAKHVIR